MKSLLLLSLLALVLVQARKNPIGNEHLSPEEYYEQDRSVHDRSKPTEYEAEVPLPPGRQPDPRPPLRNLRKPGEDPQPQRRRPRSAEDLERSRAEFENQLFRCYEENTRLHAIMDQGRVMSTEDSETAPSNSARPKSITAHVLETLRRARITGADTIDLCQQELLPVLSARRTPSETRQALRQQVEDEWSPEDGQQRARNLVIEPSEESLQFSYEFLGPEGKKTCVTCQCMLDWQQELTRLAVEENRSTRRLESQFFREGNVVAVKELDVAEDTVDSFYVYLSNRGQVSRLEQYRSRVK